MARARMTAAPASLESLVAPTLGLHDAWTLHASRDSCWFGGSSEPPVGLVAASRHITGPARHTRPLPSFPSCKHIGRAGSGRKAS